MQCTTLIIEHDRVRISTVRGLTVSNMNFYDCIVHVVVVNDNGDNSP